MRYAALLLFALPLSAQAGWDYYTLNAAGDWEPASRFELNLALPDVDAGQADRPEPRIMIHYDTQRDAPQPAKGQPWLRTIDPELVQSVE